MTSATGHREVRHGTSYVVYTRTFAAPIHDVWAALTEPTRLERWIGTWTGDPATGEVDFTMTGEGDNVQPERYRLDVCTRPTRLVARTWTDDDPATIWHLERDLAEDEAGVMTLTFAQAMTDPGIAESVGPGWDYYLDRLIAAEHGDGADSVVWDDYYPALADHYRREFGSLQRADPVSLTIGAPHGVVGRLPIPAPIQSALAKPVPEPAPLTDPPTKQSWSPRGMTAKATGHPSPELR